MGFTDAIRTCLRQYATFSGRARRSEFWWWWLFTLLASMVASGLDQAVLGYSFTSADETGPIGGIVGLLLCLPTLAVTARRLHDINKSGWWQLISLIPIVGWILMLVWTIRNGDAGDNLFGPDPKGVTGSTGYPDIQDYVPPRPY